MSLREIELAAEVERLKAQITVLVAKEIQMQARLEALAAKCERSARSPGHYEQAYDACARDLRSLLTLTN